MKLLGQRSLTESVVRDPRGDTYDCQPQGGREQGWDDMAKDRSINKCRMIREGAIIPFGQQGVKDDFQVVLHVGCRIAARFIQTPHHVHRRS